MTTRPPRPQSTSFRPSSVECRCQPSRRSGPPARTLPAHLKLDLDHTILKADESATLTLIVFSDGALNDKGLQLLLDLPNDLVTTSGAKGKLRWDVPALALGEAFRQVVQITIDKPKQALKQGVLTLQATLSAPSADTLSTTRLLGVAPTTPAPETQATTDGAVLQNPIGDVMLLVKPGAVKEGVTFRYTELRRVPRPKVSSQRQAPQVAPTTVFTLTRPVTTTQTGLSNWLYLPLANSGAANAQAQAATQLTDTTGVTGTVPPPTDTIQPVSDHNVDAYAIWQLDALQNGTRVPTFTEDVQLVVTLHDWIAQGVDPTRTGLWTRESDTERWVAVHSEYDEATQTLSAWLPHFSQFSLAQGLTENGELLPSVRAMTTDRFTGAATVQYPIETPKGLGGLTPNLSLSYSSVTLDDMFRNEGPTSYKVEASGVGLGWAVGGVRYIARSGGNIDNDTPYSDREYVMALNGQHVRLKFEDNAWRTDPAIFAKVDRNGVVDGGRHDYAQWTITTADGVKYTFGDPNVSDTTFVNTTPTATFIERQSGGAYERLAKEWYLVQVNDPLGNHMDYSYRAEQATESCRAGGWYISAIDPTQITWSQHGPIGPHLRVLFNYDGAARGDWGIDGSATNDCKEAKFAQYNRLLSLNVQAMDTGGSWQTLRTYRLNQGYITYSSSLSRLVLNSIDQLGKNGSVLQTYAFSYENTAPTTIRLKTANNGWGGKITYTYQQHRPSCDGSICNSAAGYHWRNPVVRTDVQDGIGNTTTTLFCYGPTDLDSSGNRINGNGACSSTAVTYQCDNGQKEWSAVDNSGEFMSFCRSDAITWAVNSSTPTPIKWERLDTWQGPRLNPDPRRGRTARVELRSSETAALLSLIHYNWNAFQMNGNGGWNTDPSFVQTRTGDTDYHVVWVRLDDTDNWTAGVGKWTKQSYETTRQNNQQFGNVTQVQEFSHDETMLAYSSTNPADITWSVLVARNQVPLKRTTVTEYFPNVTTNLVNKPARVRIYNGSGSCQSETRTIYDNLEGNYNSLPTLGLVAKTQQARTSCADTLSPVNDIYNATWAASWQETRIAYDGYGNQTVIHHVGTSSANDDHTITTYDGYYHLFPVTQYSYQNSAFQETATYYGVNGLGLGDSKAFWGALQEYCAVNEVCTRQSYDEFGRRIYRWDSVPKGSAWDTNANASVNYGYLAYGGAQTTNVVAEWHNPRSEGNFTRKLYNGLGQLVQEQTPYQGWTTTSGQEILVDHAYDAFGQQTQVSVPHLVATYSSGNIYRGASYAAGVTTTAYDALGRPTQTTAPNGEQTFYGYLGRASDSYTRDRAKATNQADAYRINWWQEVDSLGRVANVRTWTYNANGSWTENARVAFTHDATGNLTSVTHPNSIGTTTMGYDLLGHKMSMNLV
ncbi:MAG: hypothetical protein U0350_50315 [Caldilineaceae bacterium]